VEGEGMENKIYKLLLEMKSEMQEMKSEMKREFKTLHERMDRLENQMLLGFREMKQQIYL
jgi:DNA-binding ferritin-like protein (Dps family)